MRSHTLSSTPPFLTSLCLGALLLVLASPLVASAQPRAATPLTLARLSACMRGFTGSEGTDADLQPLLIASACLAGCQDVGPLMWEWISAPSLKSGACELACSGAAWEQAAADDSAGRWQRLVGACPKGYFPLPADSEPLVSPLLLTLARVSQFLMQASARKEPEIVGACKEIQGWLKERQFRLPLPPRLSGRYQLVSTEQPAIGRFDLGVYVWVAAKELRVGVSPTVKLSEQGALVIPSVGGSFPGQPVALTDLAAALSRADVALRDSVTRFGARFDANLDDIAASNPVLKSVMAMRSEEEVFDRRAPLLLIDGGLPAARLASVISALGERGARLAVVDKDLHVRWHAVRLRNPTGRKAPALSATLRLGMKGYTLWAGDPAQSAPALSDALPSGERRAKLLRHNVPQWINRPEEKPARIECGANLPVTEIVAVLDSLARARIWESALLIR